MSSYSPPAKALEAFRSSFFPETYAADVIAVAKKALAQVGKHPKLGEGFMDLHVQNLDVMDVYHDGQPEVFARVLGGGNFTFVWLAYGKNQPKVLKVQTGPAAGGGHAGPNFVDTADIDGDGIDEVVIEEQEDSSRRYDIYKLTRDEVQLVFRGGDYGC